MSIDFVLAILDAQDLYLDHLQWKDILPEWKWYITRITSLRIILLIVVDRWVAEPLVLNLWWIVDDEDNTHGID